jgi:hypothetical protein
MRRYHRFLPVFVALAPLLVTPVLPAAGDTTRVSVATDGSQGNSFSSRASISADGRFVAFESPASNLVAGDTNGTYDVFVHDRTTGATTRVSVATDGTQGNSGSGRVSISADGRFVAFQSSASNLVAGDTNLAYDVFVHDRTTGATTRVSVATDGTQGNSNSAYPNPSADGRFVAFVSLASNLVAGDTNGVEDIFVHDRTTGATTRVSVATDGSQGNGYSAGSHISADGRFVAFDSRASNLVAGDTNGTSDVFVHDRTTGATTRVSVATDGSQGNSDSWLGLRSLSADGRFVAFDSSASNLVAGDTNGAGDIFVHESDVDPPFLLSITRQAPAASPTNATAVTFRATFSEDVQNVGPADFSLATSGTATGTINSIVVQSAAVYDVVITAVSGDGALDLNFAPGNDIADMAGNPLGSSPTIGAEETYTIDTTAPSVTINQAAGQADPTSVSPVNFAVVFSEPVADFATGDVDLSGTAGATAAAVTEAGPMDGTTYNVATSGMTSGGTVVITIAAGVAHDAASNGNTASINEDNSVAFAFGTTTTLTSGANPSTLGQAVTFTATVTAAGGTPTGTVVFRDGGTTLGTVDLDAAGQATFTTSSLQLGTHTITAEYLGDANFSGSVSPGLDQDVQFEPGAIPTLTEWGLALLMVLLGTVSALYLKRRTPIA